MVQRYYNKAEIKTDIKKLSKEIETEKFFELKNINKINENNSTSSDVPKIKLHQSGNPKNITTPLKRSQKH